MRSVEEERKEGDPWFQPADSRFWGGVILEGWSRAHHIGAFVVGGPLCLNSIERLLTGVFCSVTCGGPRRHGAQGHLGQQETLVTDQLENQTDDDRHREADMEHRDAPVLDSSELRCRVC